jgi:hypothetical protein
MLANTAPSHSHTPSVSGSSASARPGERSSEKLSSSIAAPLRTSCTPREGVSPPRRSSRRATGGPSSGSSTSTATAPAATKPAVRAKPAGTAAMGAAAAPAKNTASSIARSSSRSSTTEPSTVAAGRPNRFWNPNARTASPARSGSTLLSAMLATNGVTQSRTRSRRSNAASIHHQRTTRSAYPAASRPSASSNPPADRRDAARTNAAPSMPRSSSTSAATETSRPSASLSFAPPFMPPPRRCARECGRVAAAGARGLRGRGSAPPPRTAGRHRARSRAAPSPGTAAGA